jgi:hypothetical protein
MLKIYDDLFSDDFLMDSFIFYSNEVLWKPTNIANRRTFPVGSPLAKGSHILLGAFFKPENNDVPPIIQDPFEWFMYNFSDELGENVELTRIDCNLQTYMLDGTAHRDRYHDDGSDRTLLFYPHYKWKDNWGGEFQVLNDDMETIQSIEIKPGRMVYIDSSVLHRGLGPTHKYIYRLCTAYRLRVKQ